MKLLRNIRLPRAATVIAGLALFAALGGSATAATKLITGKSIKNGSISSTDIKNGSLGAGDMSKKARASLKGVAGAKGATGAQGVPGPSGAAGPRGVVTPQTAVDSSENIAANNVDTPIVGKSIVTGGSYVVSYKATLFSLNADLVECSLQNDGVPIDTTQWNPAAAGGLRTSVSMSAVTNVAAGDLVGVVCTKSGASAGSASDSKLIAIPVG
jgi:hypothetical protein